MMTDLELALDAAQYGANVFLKKFGVPSFCEIEDVYAQANVVTLAYMNSDHYQRRYVYTRAFNGLIDWVRYESRRKLRLVADQEKENLRWQNTEPADGEDDRSAISRLVQKLPIDDQIIVDLVFYKGENQKAAARQLGVTESWVSKRLMAIKADLRRKFCEMC